MCLCTYQKKDKNTEFVIGTLVIKAAWLTWGCSYVTSDQWCYSPLPDSPFTSYLAPHTESLCAKARAISPLTATLSVCVCVLIHVQQLPASLPVCLCVCLCVCVISLSPPFFSKAIGDQWRLKVTNHPTPPFSSLHPTSSSFSSLLHLSSCSPRKGLLGPEVSFIFGTRAPVEGLQRMRGSGGQLLLCFNWHYHFSRLTEMDHPAGRSEARERVLAWWTW